MYKIQRYYKKHQGLFISIATLCVMAALLMPSNPYQYIFYLLACFFTFIPILMNAVQSLRFKIISIEVLISLAVIGALIIGEYSEAGIVTTLYQLGNFLEIKALKKTRQTIQSVLNLKPTEAMLILDNTTMISISVKEIKTGDMLLIREGDRVPVDVEVVDGMGYLDTSSLTGESLLREVKTGDSILSGTVLVEGLLRVEAIRVGKDATFNRLLSLIERAQDNKSEIEKKIDRFAQVYTPIVLLISIITYLFTLNFKFSITIMVLSCPGALVIGIPLANVAGIGLAAKSGIIFKGSEAMQRLAAADAIFFDKTGTLTLGQPKVVYFDTSQDKKNILEAVGAIESHANHPLAHALLEYINESNIEFDSNVASLETTKGKGISGKYKGHLYHLGNARFMKDNAIELRYKYEDATIVYISKGMVNVGVFGLQDKIKPNTREVIDALYRMGIKHQVMITGDHETIAQEVAQAINIHEVYSDVLPEEKGLIVESHPSQIKVFIGDGINDSLAMLKSDVSMAMGNGTEIAIDVSDVILMRQDTHVITDTLIIARKTVAILNQNLIFAIASVVFLIVGLFFDMIHMGTGMLIHEISILVVTINAIRLLYMKRRK